MLISYGAAMAHGHDHGKRRRWDRFASKLAEGSVLAGPRSGKKGFSHLISLPHLIQIDSEKYATTVGLNPIDYSSYSPSRFQLRRGSSILGHFRAYGRSAPSHPISECAQSPVEPEASIDELVAEIFHYESVAGKVASADLLHVAVRQAEARVSTIEKLVAERSRALESLRAEVGGTKIHGRSKRRVRNTEGVPNLPRIARPLFHGACWKARDDGDDGDDALDANGEIRGGGDRAAAMVHHSHSKKVGSERQGPVEVDQISGKDAPDTIVDSGHFPATSSPRSVGSGLQKIQPGTDIDDAVAKGEADIRRLRAEVQAAYLVLLEIESVLEKRLEHDDLLFLLLDRLFFRQPGWEQEPVAVAMAPVITSMPKKKIEIEDKLWQAEREKEGMIAARSDYSTAEAYLLDAMALLRTVVTELTAARTANVVDMLQNGNSAAEATAEVYERMRSAKVAAAHTESKLRLAILCAPAISESTLAAEATALLIPSVRVQELESTGLNVLTRKAIVGALSKARTTMQDCTDAIAHATSRSARIEADIVAIDAKIQYIRQEVIEGRLSVLHEHFVSRGVEFQR